MVEIKIGERASVKVWREGEWTILYAEDGGGGITTTSLTTAQAIDLATLLRGSAITAAVSATGLSREERMYGYDFGKRKEPCGDCLDGHCTMNCGPSIKPKESDHVFAVPQLPRRGPRNSNGHGLRARMWPPAQGRG